jgi:lipopolysaccharide biosynthesis glycosyltransferase
LSSAIIITAADAGFFGLLCDLMLSLEAQKKSREIDVGFFDLGLTAAQRDWVTPRVTKCVEPGWDFDVPQTWRSDKPHYRALTVRPFLPQHFPGYDVYIWIDADVWLQDWRGIELYSLGAQKSDLAAAPHTDRCYPFKPAVARYRHHLFEQGYGKSAADALTPQQYMNVGVFAARADSPLWHPWAEAYQEALNRSAGAMFSEQIALNYACYGSRLRVELLPAVYNWQCHLAVPSWDPASQLFCEPYLPHAPISMVHLTYTSKNQAYDIRCLDGRSRSMSLRRPPADA